MAQGQSFDEEEIRHYNPGGYDTFKTLKYSVIGIGVVGAALSITAFVNDAWGIGFFIVIVGTLINWVLLAVMNEEQKLARKNRFRQQSELLHLQRENRVMVSKIEAQKAGDILIAGEGATIVNRSILMNSMNKVESSDPGLAEALKIIGGFVERSQNKEAAEVFNEFNKRIEAGENKIVVKSLWERLTGILPDVLKLTDVVSKIVTFIGALA